MSISIADYISIPCKEIGKRKRDPEMDGFTNEIFQQFHSIDVIDDELFS
ncbi:MAG: hypothetical protein Satyrvirus2_68 [Satyrvirus sp.]|uniref:Uncharacterized protein n=1 Tax=Satyrvirus sp. TaxID=2487771 RepID=A0A3G5AD20_9VIRU|nr:MAG: hypothetical protein Satyrvirus2_68 [Satyrvirus sp.]